MVVKATRDLVWSNKTDMWFKLSKGKRNRIYDFLFLQTRPRKDTDAEYVRRRDHMLVLLNNPHFASCMNAKTFLERLQSLYFVDFEEELEFNSYASFISTDDEAVTGVEFDANAKEEESDTESLDLPYDPALTEHARGSSSVGQVLVGIDGGLLRARHEPVEGHGGLESAPSQWGAREFRGGATGGGRDRVGSAGGGRGVPRTGDGRSHGGTTTLGGSSGVAGFVVDRHPSTDPEPEPATQSANLSSSSVHSVRETLATLVVLGGRSGGTLKSAGIRTTSVEVPQVRSTVQSPSGSGEPSQGPAIGSGAVRDENVSPERERRPLGLQRQPTSTEGALEDVGIGDGEGEDSEDDAGSGESSDEFGQLYGEHHEDDVDDDAMAIEMETQVVSNLSAQPEDYEDQPLTSVVNLQHRFDEASVAMSLSRASRRISIEEVIDSILGNQHVSAHPSTTPDVDDARNVKSFVAATLAFSPPNSPILPTTLADGMEGEVRGRQHITSP
ncbi:hypothetical protein CBR_g37042 [Chara braunii]|uniref:Uncharacterized protein n=1 Tax=Chara braunii TaxID=69332 RepID=A0A388LLX9_CHABU|nr:hypothetical protein CBR_g37042 [Chara braunii]|eukprot:GBG83329.1 hypothetical protein CBR_g37042 [Chara braunii]